MEAMQCYRHQFVRRLLRPVPVDVDVGEHEVADGEREHGHGDGEAGHVTRDKLSHVTRVPHLSSSVRVISA